MNERHSYDELVGVKFFRDYYAAFKQEEKRGVFDRLTNSYPILSTTNLGFITPQDNSAAFDKRKKTVDAWTRGYGPNPPPPRIPPMTFTNVPSLFKLSNLERRWSTNNVVWRISCMYNNVDFELEISSDNLSYLLLHTVIVKTTIDRPCVWVRRLSQNILVPADSPLWHKSVETNL
jgi:hypothetical protein